MRWPPGGDVEAELIAASDAVEHPCALGPLESTHRVVRDLLIAPRSTTDQNRFVGPTPAAAVPDGAGQTRDHVAPVVGREVERGTIDQLVDGARHGLAGVLVVHGEPGIGKTCLLDVVASTTTGFDTGRLVGIDHVVP